MEAEERHFESSLVFWAWCEVGAIQRLLFLCTGFCHHCSCPAASVLCGPSKFPVTACTAPVRNSENHSWQLWKVCRVCLLVLDGSFETWVKTSTGSLLEGRDSQFSCLWWKSGKRSMWASSGVCVPQGDWAKQIGKSLFSWGEKELWLPPGRNWQAYELKVALALGLQGLWGGEPLCWAWRWSVLQGLLKESSGEPRWCLAPITGTSS